MIRLRKEHKGLRLLWGIAVDMVLITIASCGSSGGGGGSLFTGDQANALAQMFATSANSALTLSTSSFRPTRLQTGNLGTLASCGPSTLIPSTNCPGGGDIYYTLNMDCTIPSGCCYQQTPCSQDSMSISGSGSITYNSCAETITSTGDHIMVNGTLHMVMTSQATISCPGAIDVDVTVTFTGTPSISVNGHEVCNGDIFITAKGHSGASNYASVSGTVCGQRIAETYDYGCAVACPGNACCYAGTYCSTCYSGGCVPTGHMDCCNGYNCPTGTQCSCTTQGCNLSCTSFLVNFSAVVPSFDALMH